MFEDVTENLRVEASKFIEQSCKLAELLPPDKKILFRLKFQYGYSNSEIAKLLGLHNGHVSRKIRKIADEINNMRKGIFPLSEKQKRRQTKKRKAEYDRTRHRQKVLQGHS